ncbi:glucosamine-6-phosphate deaminase [Candidatus Poribacteria bacterium]|nr:glucosamine-6-phosphate deaminase [Candidatus Poribacteria bacterium]
MNDEANRSESRVERNILEKSDQELIYPPMEKMGSIIVDNFPALGKLTALKLLEWVQYNPGGVISLPTGKTPEYFIKWVTYYLKNWDNDETRADMEQNGLDPTIKPDMKSLHFVQIDEFYPIPPTQHNSFYYYVNKFYIEGFGLDPDKALLIDCSKIGLPEGKDLDEVWPDSEVDILLRYNQAHTDQEKIQKTALQAIDQWCYDYEQQIRKLGGIGFFLGGIGPDGHIAFNVTGSDHNSTTRLTQMNYETQAAAATDLGGIEVAQKRLVITIGISTITYNPDCTAIIIAAGEAKAKVVHDAIQKKPHIRYPATALHQLTNARFYITQGAAKKLEERQYQSLSVQDDFSDEKIEKIIVDIALKQKKRVTELQQADMIEDCFGSILLDKPDKGLPYLVSEVENSLMQKLRAGSKARSETVFLHTAPHHDDIMLGYLPYAVRNIRDASNTHIFAYMTSGFTSVTNKYALSLVKKLQYFLDTKAFNELIDEEYFRPTNVNGQNRDLWQYLDGVAANNTLMKDEGEARRLLRNMMEIFEEEDVDNLKHRIVELINYFETQYPGRKDLPYIQQLKGMIREWEADCLWGYLGFDSQSVKHLRLGFYKGEIFTEEPKPERDIPPVLKLLKEYNPHVVTVALDPEASGPDTHYKVLQAVSEALRSYEEETGRSDIEIWGYRNVWYRFHPSEANIYVPVSLNMFAVLQNAFLNAFGSQKEASFPSHECDGPFSILSQEIQVDQYQKLKICLGRQFFNEHETPLIRATRGFVFLRSMGLKEFYSHARELRRTTENI